MSYLRLYLKNNYKNVILVIVISILLSVVSYYVSIKIKVIFNFISNMNLFSENIIIIIILFALIFILEMSLKLFQNLCKNKGNRNIILYCKEMLLRSNYEYIISNDIIKINSEIGMVSSKITELVNSLTMFVSTAIQLIIYFVIIAQISIWAVVISLIFMPAIYFLISSVKPKMEKHQKEFISHNSKASSMIVEALYKSKNIKCKNVENYFIDRVDIESNRYVDDIVKYACYESYSSNILNFIINIVPVITIYFISNIIMENSIQKEEVLLLFLFVPNLLDCAYEIFKNILTYYKTKPYIDKFNNIKVLEEENNGDIKLEEIQSIKTNKLVVKINNKNIHVPDITINKGEKVLIKGRSGVGKSTFFNVVLGLLHNYDGEITINDIDLRKLDIHTIRQLIGISFQNNNIYSMSIEDNIRLGNNTDITDLVKNIELDQLVEKRKDNIINSDNISGGEKSRIIIAQNIAQNPKVIFIDESTTNINEEMEEAILKNIMENYGHLTIVCISHRASTIKYFDRVVEFQEANLNENI